MTTAYFAPVARLNRLGPGGGGAPVFTDSFDRVNASPPGLGPSWNDPVNAWGISSNAATKNNGDHLAKFNTDLGSPDHWVEADVSGFSVGGGSFLIINARGSATDNSNCYMGFVNANTGIPTIGKNVGGGYSDVAAGTNVGVAACKLRLEVQGTAIRLYRDGALVASATDSAITAGNYVGFNCFNNGSFGAVTYDNFRCGAL
jgi:hypothetical protein